MSDYSGPGSGWAHLATKAGQATKRVATSVPRIVTATIIGTAGNQLTVELDTAPGVPVPARTAAATLPNGTRVYALTHPPRGLLVLGATDPSANGGGGACPAAMTIAELVALRDAAGLDVCATYVVTDWTTPNALPGPNVLVAHATATDALSPSVLIQTPILLGPDRGEYAWDFALMISVADPLGNQIYDIGATGAIDAFPWGQGCTNNKLIDVTFTGGYAVTSVAFATVGAALISNTIQATTIDVTGWTTGLIAYCIIDQAVITTGADFALDENIMNGPTVINSGAGSISINNSQIYAGAFTFAGPPVTITSSEVRGSQVDNTGGTGAISIADCQLESGTFVQNDGAALLDLSRCHLMEDSDIELHSTSSTGTISLVRVVTEASEISNNAAATRGLAVRYSDLRGLSAIRQHGTGGADPDSLSQISLSGSSTITLTGTNDPGSGRAVAEDSTVSEASAVNMTSGAALTSLARTRVEVGSTLNLQGGLAQVADCRFAGNSTVNTGTFAHSGVTIEFQGTTTLTAANTGTYKGFGASNVI